MTMTSEPMVSIGIPTYNHGKFLSQCLRTIVAQTYKNIEIIISNNASDDNTRAICKQFAKKDKRIRYFEQKKNIGAGNNFNLVFSKAHGKYFMWAASDDLFHKDYVKSILSELVKNPNASLGVSNMTYFKNKQKELYKLKFKNVESSIDALRTYLLHPKYISTMFYGIYKTSMLKKHFTKNGLLTNPFHFSYTEDDRLLFRVLLTGGLVHIDKYYFSKRDTTYLSKMKNGIDKNVSKSLPTIILNNFLLILSNICNFFYFQYFIYSSDKKFLQKLILTFYTGISLLLNIIDFLKNVFVFAYLVITGCIKTLVSRL